MRLFLCAAMSIISCVAYTQNDRAIDLIGTRNTRQLGGIMAEGGHVLKQNLLIRSDNLWALTPGDCDRLLSLGLKTIIDVRSDSEVASWPDAACIREAVNYVHLPLSTFGSEPTMAEAYLYLFRHSSEQIRTYFEILADPDNLPLLYHCQVGKDRAGILSALTLRLLGVPDDVVIEDYLLSRQTGYAAERGWIQAILDDVDSYGGIGAYLTSIGVSPETMQAVRENLLEVSSYAPLCDYK